MGGAVYVALLEPVKGQPGDYGTNLEYILDCFQASLARFVCTNLE
jgi:hypothetical protein